jgi:transcriptional regulator with XRE-family HTH domain
MPHDELSPQELRALRIGAGLTQRELATLSDLTMETISQFERQVRPMPTLTQYGLRQIIRQYIENQ